MVSHASAAHVSSGSRSGNLPSRESDSSRLVIRDRKSTRLNSSHSQISYAVFCLKKKKKKSFRHVQPNTPRCALRQFTPPPSLVLTSHISSSHGLPIIAIAVLHRIYTSRLNSQHH